MKKPKLVSLIFYIVIFAILLSSLSAMLNRDTRESVSYSEAVELFQAKQVRSFTIKDGVLSMTLTDDSAIKCELGSFSAFYNDLHELIAQQLEDGTLTEYDYQPDSETPFWLSLLPYLLILIIAVVVMFLLANRMGGGQSAMKFSRANARLADDGKDRVTFADVAGAEEEKQELAEIVDFLRDPQKYTAIGARIPKGVLLVGAPGTGKTLIARAVAGEANVQFLSISGSDFVELYVGVGAGRVRDLFEQAKKMAPSIIFIDEIDAVGRRRGAGLGGGHDEREQTLNQLLVEMDGFSKNEGVIVMAATNRKDILDPALLRPGRFDRQIYVDTPDVRGREAILKVHARNKPLADNVDLAVIARATVGMTGADLDNLLNEAALSAARQNQPCVTMNDMEQAMMKVVAGAEKKSRVVSEHDRRLTAIHEAGHAVSSYFLKTRDPVYQISIVPRGPAGGLTWNLPDEDDSAYWSRNEMFESIVSLLGGRIAEEIALEDISTGASNDLQRASSLARSMVMRYGMSKKLGSVVYDDDGEVFIGRDYEKTKSYSDRTAGDIDDEVKATIDRAYARCTEILTEHRAKLEEVAAYLLEHEKMNRAQFEACMEGREIPTREQSLFESFTRKEPSEQIDPPQETSSDKTDAPADSDSAPTPPEETESQ